MDTMTIELTNQRAYKLIKSLEELHLIRVLKETTKPQQKLSEKYAGKLPSKIADQLQEYVTQSRNEWDKSI